MIARTTNIAKNWLSKNFENRYAKSVLDNFKRTSGQYVTKVLTNEQEKEIQNYYLKHLGRKVDTIYHRYFYNRNGIFSPKYIPTSLYKSAIIPRLNDMRMMAAYVDKNQFSKLFPQINHPQAIVNVINGYYYHNNRSITKEKAITLCSDMENAIIKPSLESIHGAQVMGLDTRNSVNEDGRKLEDIFNFYGNHFIVQKKLQQHELMAALNPTSVNTLRLYTLRRGNDIELVYSVIRIGRKGRIIDNESSGGITAKINNDGKLSDYAYGSAKDAPYQQTDSGVLIKGYKIPSYHKAIDIVKQLHYNLPYFLLAGWDISIGVDGEPAMIEWNARTELSQTAVGPAFGEFTEEILEMTRTRPTTRYFTIGKQKFNEDL